MAKKGANINLGTARVLLEEAKKRVALEKDNTRKSTARWRALSNTQKAISLAYSVLKEVP